jgi:hypothetical protein
MFVALLDEIIRKDNTLASAIENNKVIPTI